MRIFIISLIILTLSGCSGVLARTGENHQTGSSFPGLYYATENAGSCSLYALYGFFPALIVTIPIGLVDMAASFVTDIILLPVDLLVEDPGGSKKVLCEIKWGP